LIDKLLRITQNTFVRSFYFFAVLLELFRFLPSAFCCVLLLLLLLLVPLLCVCVCVLLMPA